MNLSKNFIITLLILFPKIIFCQIPDEAIKDLSIEEEKDYIRLLCYSDLLQISTYLTFDSYKGLIKYSNKIFQFDTLASKGIEGATFFKVYFKSFSEIDKIYNKLEQEGNFIRSIQQFRGNEKFLFSKHEYIFASSSNGLYKISGFRVNDFRKFYADCFNTGDCFKDENIKENRSNISDKKLIKTWSVEGIDLWCMYKKYVKGKKSKNDCFNFNQE